MEIENPYLREGEKNECHRTSELNKDVWKSQGY